MQKLIVAGSRHIDLDAQQMNAMLMLWYFQQPSPHGTTVEIVHGGPQQKAAYYRKRKVEEMERAKEDFLRIIG